ncbi:Translation initiation factor eIF-2B subunit beta [Dermatophagoides farinae]|uniref:Translation initiation factor eIF2B subunit beta n=1 Tax=Dermatophagoides farinae TaxID=6954 RepID=A0A922I5M8_DERFA|nr:Translation initiation factor eIF-2B subunit beta [Dermatophagoides farinae]
MEMDYDKKLNEFLLQIKNGQISGSYNFAKQTVLLIQDLIINTEWTKIRDMIEKVQEIGKILIKEQPTEPVIDNMVKRILKIIREEFNHIRGIRDDEAIGELLSELETSGENIAQQAMEHIYWDEVILTIGRSKTVEAFLKFVAKKKRKFQVIVAECGPDNNGHDLAISLAKENINTILIHDSAIFSVMSRVNKVIIGTHSIMANGGIKSVSGTYTLALAAKQYSVPFIVCTGMFKLTPKHMASYDQMAFNKFSSPEKVLNYEYSYSVECQVVNPAFDYVPPELITIFVSNIGGTTPSDVYRLLGELYHPADELAI